MDKQSVIHSTFVLERNYPVPAERVFAAFADPVKKCKWFVEGEGHAVEHYVLDFRAGGRELARFRFTEDSPVKGLACTNETTYLDIVPNRRVVLASTMTVGDRCISASLGTIEFLRSQTGTGLIFTFQGAFFEGADGPEMREAGWRKLFDRLAGELAQ